MFNPKQKDEYANKLTSFMLIA